MIEGTRAYPNAKPIGGFFGDAVRREDAERGSQRLRDAILLAKGRPLPERKRNVSAQVPVEPRHLPDCCASCGSPLKPQALLVSHIQAEVSAYYRINPIEMTSARRAHEFSHPRQIAMYLAAELTPKSLPDIGRRFGGRDHTTVIHAKRAVEQRIAKDPEIAADVMVLRERLAA